MTPPRCPRCDRPLAGDLCLRFDCDAHAEVTATLARCLRSNETPARAAETDDALDEFRRGMEETLAADPKARALVAKLGQG